MKFNETKSNESTRTTNRAGGEAFAPDDPKLQLYKLTINNLLENTYYRDDEDALAEVRQAFDAVVEESPRFPLNLAWYARQEMGLRTIPQVLLVLSAHDESAKFFVRPYTPKIVQRADEPATALAVHDSLFGGTAPKPLKKGLADALHNFDHYQFAKYDTNRREVNLRDVVNRVHPKPQDETREEIFRRLIRGPLDDYPDVEPLDPPKTWEVVVSETVAGRIPQSFSDHKRKWIDANEQKVRQVKGIDPDRPLDLSVDQAIDAYNALKMRETKLDFETPGWKGGLFGSSFSETEIEEFRRAGKREGYQKVLEANKMGLFARLRNLRNMMDVGIPFHQIFDHGDLEHVRQSQIYPFRFYQAYVALKREGILNETSREWLEEAIEASVGSISDPHSPDHAFGDTFAVADVSGSMDAPLSDNSSLTYKEISAFFTAVLGKHGAATGAFADTFEPVMPGRQAGVLDATDEILSANVGGSTNGWKAIDWLTENEVSVDRIVMLTDMQIWDSSYAWEDANTVRKSFATYRGKVKPETSLYMVDLSSYGSLVTPEGWEGVYDIQGWNDQIIDYIRAADNAGDIIEEIDDLLFADDVRQLEPVGDE